MICCECSSFKAGGEGIEDKDYDSAPTYVVLYAKLRGGTWERSFLWKYKRALQM